MRFTKANQFLTTNFQLKNMLKDNTNSWLLRCSTARGSSTGLFLVGPTKVNACKSFLFTEGSPEGEKV